MSELTEEDFERGDDFDADSINSDEYTYDEESLVDEVANQNKVEVDVDKTFPIRRASSCNTYCVLCDSNNTAITRQSDGGFALRKVASCSLCTWDIEERMSDGEANLSADEGFEPTLLKRSNSYTLAMDENDFMSEIDHQMNESNSHHRSDTEDNEGQIDMLRSPPDGGESHTEELEKSLHVASVDEAILETKKNDNQIFNDTSAAHRNDKNDENNYNGSKSSKKENKIKNNRKNKDRSRNSLDKKATQELDEIFGRISRTPESVTFVDDYDRFSLNYSNDSFESLTSSGKKSKKFLKRLLPPRSLFGKRLSNLSAQKSRSVEYLYATNSRAADMLHKSLSTIEIASCGLENTGLYEDEFEVDKTINEKWINYLNRIGGMSVFGGNQTLRYVWHQINCYQNELLQPFEDVMKHLIEELQQAYIKCQEMEGLMTMKTEQQEKETSKIYEDVEHVMQLERQQMHEKHSEKEEHTRTEYNKLLEMKEQEIQELTRKNNELSEKNDKLHVDNLDIINSKENIENQINQLLASEKNMKIESETLLEEKAILLDRIKEYDASMRELHDNVCQATKVAEFEKENYRQCLRRYQDLVEEKEFLDVNISNLSSELDDLRNQNKSFQEQQHNWTSNSSIHYERAVSSINPLDDTFDANRSIETYSQRAVSPDNMTIDSFTSSQSSENQQTATPCIQTPKEINPLKQRHFDQGKSVLSSTVRKSMHHKNSVQTPIRLASSKHSDFKVIFTGDANVGKTSLIRRICHGKFRPHRDVTFEADYSTKTVEYKDQSVHLKLWDTVGQERFNSIPPSYFRNSDVVILMYDIEDDASFFNVKTWIGTVHDYTNENVFLVVVANKSDLHHKRRIPTEKGKQLAKAHDAMYVETSAKTDENVSVLCEMIASTLIERDDTVFIRNDFDSSLCSLSYSQRKFRSTSICCQ